MIIRKPYAFFIKYFRFIDLILVFLFGYLSYKLSAISVLFNQIYLGSFTNYSSLGSLYVGFKVFLTIIILCLVLTGIILLFRAKKKPLKDYLFASLYLIVIIIYIFFINNTFYTLENSIIEQTALKLYSDISFIIILPS